MIHKVINFLVMLILLTATACQFRINDGENKLMLLPATYNLENLNSKYDDYNLTAPPNYDQGLSVVYSTKYNEHNEERGFDVYEGSIVFEINRYGNGNNSYGNCSLKTSRDNAITYLNTIYNERGPIWISDYYRDFDTFKDDSSHFYFVSTDRPTSNIDSVNDYNILGFYLDENRKCQQVNFAGNTEGYNELYPCIDYTRQTIYFCNDKDGTYNIYSWTYNTDDKRKLVDILQTEDILPNAAKLSINSDKNDECPYIFGDYLYFVSDRDGGKGGYDIYYCKINDNGTYGEVTSLGENINTEYNEYRVSGYSLGADKSTPDLIIYSSDRKYDRAKGGYDLYLSVLKEVEIKENELF